MQNANANVMSTIEGIVRIHLASSREMSTYEVFEAGFKQAGMDFNLSNLRGVFNTAKEPEGLETIAAELARFNDSELTDDIRGEAGVYVEEDGLFYMEYLPELREEWIIAKVVADPPIFFNTDEEAVNEWQASIFNEAKTLLDEEAFNEWQATFNEWKATTEWKAGILNEDWHHEVAGRLTEVEIAGEGLEFNTNNINSIYPYYSWNLDQDGGLVNNPIVMKTVERIYQNQVLGKK